MEVVNSLLLLLLVLLDSLLTCVFAKLAKVEVDTHALLDGLQLLIFSTIYIQLGLPLLSFLSFPSSKYVFFSFLCQ